MGSPRGAVSKPSEGVAVKGLTRIAYVGPAPQSGGGVTGMAAIVLEHLLEGGHAIDCYVSHLQKPLPEGLRERAGFELIDGGSRFQYDAWYSRTELTKFINGQVMRAFTERRLADVLMSRHRLRPYDVVYQFSHVEVFRLGGQRMPPLIVHPETHAAGELRWFRDERALVQRCEPFHRRWAARAILAGRTAVQRRHVRLAAGFVCPSRAFQRDFCADYGVDAERTRVVPNPIDLARFRPQPRMDAPSAPIRVLYVGRISVRKGVETVVELSHRLADLAGSVALEIVGDRTQWSDYSDLLVDLDPRVASYRGRVSADEMPALMASADLLIQPSKYEPFGLTVGEALASGLPVVATDAVGAAENVARECARIVPVGNVAAFEREVRSLIDEIRAGGKCRLSTLARSEAERLFHPKEIAEAIGSVLQEVSV